MATVEEEVVRLTAVVEDLKISCEIWRQGCHSRRVERDEATSISRKLLQALERHGVHDFTCHDPEISGSEDWPCTCGLATAKALVDTNDD